MSKHGGRRIDRRTAERLLRGAPVDVPDALAGLLAAAAAPPRDGELGGEPVAVAAFSEAVQRAPVPRPRSPGRPAKLLVVKALAAATAIFAVGGIATAAVTGHLPIPGGGGPSPVAPASSHSAIPTPVPPGSSRAPGETRAEQQPSPSPSLPGLCHAYTAGNKSEHGKALENPAFTALITAAGGKDKVDGYCASLLKDEPSAKGSDGSKNDGAKPDHSPKGHDATRTHPPHPTH